MGLPWVRGQVKLDRMQDDQDAGDHSAKVGEDLMRECLERLSI